MKMQIATEWAHDVKVNDGGCIYFLDFPDGKDEMTPQEVADDFLEKYDGEQEVEFSVTFSCDDSRHNYAGFSGRPAVEI